LLGWVISPVLSTSCLKTVSGRPLRRAEPDARQTGTRGQVRNTRAVDAGASWMRCGAAEAHRHVSGSSKAGLPRENPASRSSTLRRTGLREALPEVGDTRKGRGRTDARARWAPRTCIRSSVAFSRRTSRKGARNKPQRNSCQLPGQLSGTTGPQSPASVGNNSGGSGVWEKSKSSRRSPRMGIVSRTEMRGSGRPSVVGSRRSPPRNTSSMNLT